MRRLSKVPVVFALASLCLLGMFAASCGSTGNAQVRLVNAISDAPTALDVDVNTTKVFTNISFGSVQPTPPAYSSVPSGTVTLQAVVTGTTTTFINPVNTTLSGSSHYTLLMTGFNNGPTGTAPRFWSISDNNTAPTTGNIEFRIINAAANSASYTGGLDIYIVQPGQGLGTPAVSGLTYGQGSAYISENFNAAGYTVVVVNPQNNNQQLFSVTYPTPTGSIRTLVLVDTGNSINSFLELNDLG